MNINTLVNLTITISDRSVQGIDLGIPLLLGYHTHWPEFVKPYSDHDEMLDDGFTTDDYLYKMARALKSQEKPPPIFKVGRRTTSLVQTIRMIPTVLTPGYVYRGTIKGTAWSFTVQNGDVLADVCDDLVTATTGITGFTPTDGTTFVTGTATTGLWLDYDLDPAINVLDLTPDTTTEDALVACVAADDDWYGLLVESSSPASIALVAADIEARRKVAIVQSADHVILDGGSTSDIAYTLHAAGYNRTFGIWHKKIGGNEWLAASWAAGRMTAQPGSETWAFKTLNGVSFDTLTTAAQTSLAAKDWSHYTQTAKRSMTFDGKAGGGRYGDITRFVDWLFSDIQTSVVALLGDNPKVDYTNEGAAAVQSVVLGSLLRGEKAHGLRKGKSVVTVPAIEDIPASVRATRILPDVEFFAELTGAFHGVAITGRVTT